VLLFDQRSSLDISFAQVGFAAFGYARVSLNIGLDDETLMGGPPQMLTGRLADLRRSGGVIVDVIGAEGKLAHVLPNGKSLPLKVGDQMEINDNQSVVVGICKVTQTFQANRM
jgi:putative ABC transport system permease protein